MGERVEPSSLVVPNDPAVQQRLQRCVAALRHMVDGGLFSGHEDTIGMEVELDLELVIVGQDFYPPAAAEIISCA